MCLQSWGCCLGSARHWLPLGFYCRCCCLSWQTCYVLVALRYDKHLPPLWQRRRESLLLGPWHYLFPHHQCYQLLLGMEGNCQVPHFRTSERSLASVIRHHHTTWTLWVWPLNTCELGWEQGRRWGSWCVLNHRWLLQAIKNKYASSKLLQISTLPQLNSKTIRELASPLMGRS